MTCGLAKSNTPAFGSASPRRTLMSDDCLWRGHDAPVASRAELHPCTTPAAVHAPAQGDSTPSQSHAKARRGYQQDDPTSDPYGPSNRALITISSQG
jgi:hypothetical protein